MFLLFLPVNQGHFCIFATLLTTSTGRSPVGANDQREVRTDIKSFGAKNLHFDNFLRHIL